MAIIPIQHDLGDDLIVCDACYRDYLRVLDGERMPRPISGMPHEIEFLAVLIKLRDEL